MNNNIKLAFAVLLFCGFTSNAQEKVKLEADKKTSSISYSMKHPMHEWDAISKESKCVMVLNKTTNKIEAIAVVIPVKSFDSDNSNRDSHAIEVLEALKFPNVSFSSSNIVENNESVTATGNLTFHGVTKKVEITGTKKTTKGKIVLNGAFQVKMTDYNIEVPGLMGIKAEDLIKLKFNMNFNI